MIGGMARTVTVHDPATDSTFRATRRQWERLYAKSMTMLADEDGNPVAGQKAKPPASKPDPAPEQE